MRQLTDDELDLILELTDVKVEPCTCFEGPVMASAWKAYVSRLDRHGGSRYFCNTSQTRSGAVTGLLIALKKHRF